MAWFKFSESVSTIIFVGIEKNKVGIVTRSGIDLGCIVWIFAASNREVGNLRKKWIGSKDFRKSWTWIDRLVGNVGSDREPSKKKRIWLNWSDSCSSEQTWGSRCSVLKRDPDSDSGCSGLKRQDWKGSRLEIEIGKKWDSESGLKNNTWDRDETRIEN